MIFPADEVVYLSYGRIIYVPTSPATIPPHAENRQNEQIHQQHQQQYQRQPSLDRSNSRREQPPPLTGSSSSRFQSRGSYSSAPSTSTGSSRSFRSTASAPANNEPKDATLNRSSIIASRSFEILNQPERPKREKRKQRAEKNALRQTFLEVPKAPARRSDRRLSYSDFAHANRPERGAKTATLSVKSGESEADCSRYKSERKDHKLPVAVTQYSKPEKSPGVKKKGFFSGARLKRAPEAVANMATNDSALKDLIHPHYNEHLKTHNSVTFKLVRTVSDFTQQLGQMYEQHAEELQMLVANFRKRNGELRKERPACPSSLFHTWETLLQEVEIDSQALGEIASILGRQVSRPLLEKSFYRKIQSRKVFTHRESYDTIIAKTEEKLAKCRQDYKNAYLSYLTTPTTDSLSAYFNTHNTYIQQLHATNGMLEEYSKETLPQLLQEVEEIYCDLCSTVTEAVLQGAEVVSSRAMEQCRRYDGLIGQCKVATGSNDLAHLARALPAPTGRGPIVRRPFVPPQPPPPQDQAEDGQDVQTDSIPPPLKDELVIDRLASVQVKPSFDALKKEAADLELQIKQIQEALDTLLRIQQRSVEANLFNKANEIQEDISMKRFDLRVAQIHLRAINSQKELFSNKLDTGETGRERKNSSSSTASMKTKWLKALKSLKTPPPEEKKNGSAATRELLKGDPDAHNFQEYTYKKITPCDVCSQVLRGHTRQGLKCRICKMNIHIDCQEKVPKCEAKARLLRRQKSTSEIETRIPDATVEEESLGFDESYSGMPTMNRQLSVKNDRLPNPADLPIDRRHAQGPSTSDSSMRRRLFAGMKSLTGFGSRSRQGSPGHRSISLPEKRNSQDGSGNRPFGQPLCLGPETLENGDDIGNFSPPTPPSPSPSKAKIHAQYRKNGKQKK